MTIFAHFACQVGGKHQNGPPEFRRSLTAIGGNAFSRGAALLAGREQDGWHQ